MRGLSKCIHYYLNVMERTLFFTSYKYNASIITINDDVQDDYDYNQTFSYSPTFKKCFKTKTLTVFHFYRKSHCSKSSHINKNRKNFYSFTNGINLMNIAENKRILISI